MSLNELIINGISYNQENDLGTAIYGINEINNHSYFRPKSFEKSKFYEYLGVKYFKKLLMNTFGKLVKNEVTNSYYVGNKRTIDALLSFEKYTRINESIHLTGSLFSLTSLLFSDNFSLLGFLGLALNLYCYLIQRYNRARVLNTLESKVL
jgi:hypothetical protein